MSKDIIPITNVTQTETQLQFLLQFQVLLPVRMMESPLAYFLNYESEEAYQNSDEIDSNQKANSF